MAKIKKKAIGITETVLRDAHQSLIATKMTLDDMEGILDLLDSVGYHSLEVWGGATFDACLRFLNEDPWHRLRVIRSKVKETKLQMLLRGQNLLGYKHYADDVVEYFVQKAVSNGIDIIRVFDALNDLRNIETAVKACKKEGGHAQGTISYTTSPVHNLNSFVSAAKRLQDMGADSICIKDMAGLLMPTVAYDLIQAIKSSISIPVQLHSHYTTGTASMTYLKAIEAGVDVIDCAISPLAMGTSQPPTESIVAALNGTNYETGYKLEILSNISSHFKKLKKEYIKKGLLDPEIMNVDVNALMYQVPGGMISNLISQLRQANAQDRYREVLEQIPEVRRDAGYPPLVTPTSQIVGSQAVLNVLSKEPYKMVSKEFRALIKGEYGKTPAPIPVKIRNKILGQDKLITCRPADLIPPELDNIKLKLNPKLIEQEEDILSYALFPQVAEQFFKTRREQQISHRPQKSNDTQNVSDDVRQEENENIQKDSNECQGEVVAAISAAISCITSTSSKTFNLKTFRRLPLWLNSWNISGRK